MSDIKDVDDIKDVVIIGGGITGLATAYYLQEEARAAGRPLDFVLLESSERLGGKITTQRQDGFTIEGGPDCFIAQKPWAADLCDRLGLGGELMGTNDARRKTFVLSHGRLTPLPDGVMLIIPTRIAPFVTSPLISWPGKMRMGLDLLIPRRRDNADESIGDFVRRRLGQEALDKIAEPLLSGIHVSDPEQQSLLGTFPRFRALEMKHGSLIKGMLAQKRRTARNGRTNGHGPAQGAAQSTAAPVNGRANGHDGASPASPRPATIFWTLRGGLGQMIDGLGKALAGRTVTGARVDCLERVAADDGRGLCYRATTADGAAYCGRAVVLATPAYVSGALVAELAPQLAQALASIRYVSTATVSLGYRRSDLDRDLNGFGLVIPRTERRQISACTWTSTKFSYRAPQDKVLVRCFVGGPGHEYMVDKSDEELTTICRQEMAELMGIHAEPIVTRIFRWYKANPQYDVGHLDRMRAMQALAEEQPGLFVSGSAYDGVGIPDCVRQGQQAARKALRYLADGR